jgi:MFS family permease
MVGAAAPTSRRTGHYRLLVRQPGAMRIATLSLLGRLAFAMTNLSLLLYVNAATDNLAVAGAAAATNLVGTAVTAVIQGRWFDRYGVRRTLWCLTAAYAPLTSLMMALVESRQPAWILLSVTLPQSLSTPMIGVATRTMLPHLTPEGPLRDALIRYWTISFECCYVLAPALTGMLAATLSTRTPFISSALLLTVASATYAALPAIGKHRGCAPPRVGTSAAHPPAGLVTLVIAALGFGAAVGFVVITTTAAATTLGKPHAIGWLFALMTMCSVGGGIAFGIRSWPRRAELQLPILLLASACALLIPLTGRHIPTLMLSVAAAGVTFAPQLTVQSTILNEIVPWQRVGVSFGWLTTAAALGNGVAQAIGGALGQAFTSSAAASVGALTVGATAGTVALRRNSLISPTRAQRRGRALTHQLRNQGK